MKKIRIILSTLAIVFAFGGTFAMQYHSDSSIIAYEYIPASEEGPVQCLEISTDCGPSGTTVCMENSHEVRQNSDEQTQCGLTLKRP